jgi:hypothetical protein
LSSSRHSLTSRPCVSKEGEQILKQLIEEWQSLNSSLNRIV